MIRADQGIFTNIYRGNGGQTQILAMALLPVSLSEKFLSV